MDRLRRLIIQPGAAAFAALCLALPTPVSAGSISLTPHPRTANPDYNVRMGLLSLGFTGWVRARYDDNLTLSDNDRRRAGWSIEPGLGVAVDLPVSPFLQLRGDVGFGYTYYPGGNGENDFWIGGSDGVLDANAEAEFLLDQKSKITVGDYYSRQVRTLDLATRGFPNDFSWNQNVIGVQYDNQLSPYFLGALRYEHTNAWSDKGRYKEQDYYADMLQAVLLWRMNRKLQWGPYLRGERFGYPNGGHNNGTSLGGGVAFVFNPREGLTLDGSVGIESMQFDTGNPPLATDSSFGLTAKSSAGVSMTLLKATVLDLRLSYVRSHVTYDPLVNFSEDLTLGTGLAYSGIKDLNLYSHVDYVLFNESDFGDEGNVIRLMLGTGYQFTRKTSGDIRYIHTTRLSNQAGQGYTDNALELTLMHKF